MKEQKDDLDFDLKTFVPNEHRRYRSFRKLKREYAQLLDKIIATVPLEQELSSHQLATIINDFIPKKFDNINSRKLHTIHTYLKKYKPQRGNHNGVTTYRYLPNDELN